MTYEESEDFLPRFKESRRACLASGSSVHSRMISRYGRLHDPEQRLAHDVTTPQLDDSHVTQRLRQAPPHTGLLRNVFQCNALGHIPAVANNTEVIDNELDLCEPNEFARLAQQVCLPFGCRGKTVFPHLFTRRPTHPPIHPPFANFQPCTNLSEVPICYTPIRKCCLKYPGA